MVKFSSDLFVQLGGQVWQTRPAEFWQAQKNASAVVESRGQGEAVSLKTQSLAPVSVLSERHQLEPAGLVLIGSGLNAIWENDEALEWQLWLNICRAFAWPEEQVTYFDTDVLSSEEAVFTTLEEIMALDVEQVLSMAPEHALSEQLAEGFAVLTVPSLSDMLADPYAKRDFYETLMRA
ncbi:hypothetical protein [Thiomicrorhabdus cannonii]|uniref:hypothetical protein n=1 Tax=Thiomicrorhabdus cannonii TaxID=2748011 RepID=UPI0015C02196|nr:hypothetical protein [Thiomicrorhabdus cannonii]